MKLAFSINGNQVTLPSDIQHISDNAGLFGQNIITFGIRVLLLGIVLLSFFFIIYAGFKWITSTGDSKQIESARNTLYYAILGLAIAFLSFLIVNTLGAFLKFPLVTHP